MLFKFIDVEIGDSECIADLDLKVKFSHLRIPEFF
jgi:hypothetical protein